VIPTLGRGSRYAALAAALLAVVATCGAAAGQGSGRETVTPALAKLGDYLNPPSALSDGRYFLLRLEPDVYRIYDAATSAPVADVDVSEFSGGNYCIPVDFEDALILINCHDESVENFDHWIVRAPSGEVVHVPPPTSGEEPPGRLSFYAVGLHWLRGFTSDPRGGGAYHYLNWHTGEFRYRGPRTDLDDPDLAPVERRRPRFTLFTASARDGRSYLYLRDRRRGSTSTTRLTRCPPGRCGARVSRRLNVVSWEIRWARRDWTAGIYRIATGEKRRWRIEFPRDVPEPGVSQTPTRYGTFVDLLMYPRGHIYGVAIYEARW
jgi:hypothetical protein